MSLKKMIKNLMALFLAIVFFSTTSIVHAENNMAFSAGKGYGDLDVSQATLSSYASYGLMGYNSYYSTSGANASILAGKFNNGTKRLESDIVFLTGHGAWDSIDTTASGGLRIGDTSTFKYVGTNDFDWEKVKLAIFLACETGQETNYEEINLAYNVFKKSNWKITSLGWHQRITDKSAISWIDNFNSKLETGANVDSAISYANSKSYADNRVKDIAFYGEPNLVLRKTRSISSINIDESNIKYITEDIFFDGQDVTPIINLLENNFGKLDINNYKVDIFTHSKENQFYTIDFTYLIDDIYTNSSYTAIVNEGKVVQISNNSVTVPSNIDTDFENYGREENIAKSIGISNTNKSNNIKCINNMESITPILIKEQQTRKYIDLIKNEKYIQVETTYSYKDSKSVAVNYYEYKI